MIIDKHLLINGNVLLWIPSNREDDIENVLILAGGGVLLLKTIKHINILHPHTKNDIMTLSSDEFVKKYKLEDYEDIYKDIKYELKTGNYPKYEENNRRNYVLSILNHLSGVSKDCLLIVKKECEKLIKEIENKKKEVIKI